MYVDINNLKENMRKCIDIQNEKKEVKLNLKYYKQNSSSDF